MNRTDEHDSRAPESSNGSVAGFIVGVLAGLVAGGAIVLPLSYVVIAVIGSMLFPRSEGHWWPLFAAIVGLAFAWWSIVRARKAIDFFAGALMGAAAATLAGSAIWAYLQANLIG